MRFVIKAGLLMICAVTCLFAESGRDAWLRYAPLKEPALSRVRQELPAVVSLSGDSPVLVTARDELIRGLRGMLGRTLRTQSGAPQENGIVIGTTESLASLKLGTTANLSADGFIIRRVRDGNSDLLVIAGANDRGALYGIFALLRKIAVGAPLSAVNESQSPYAKVRWVNEWNNLDGSIERGYGGRSIFWDKGAARDDLRRVSEYGRLLASLGINGITINNVNADRRLLTPEFAPQLARIAQALRPWGVKMGIAVDFGSPKTLGGLDTFDPLDPRVIEWWKARGEELYRAVPDLGGIVIKADSEGRVGPSAYGRTHADAANVVARAIAPHGGILFYRGFVYDHHMDWKNLKNDRARAADDNFRKLDGAFDDNVLVQIKHGPIDFQVREPASPLFGTLERTNQTIELQITQEYFGQARHTVFLPPMWKEVLDFDLHARGAGTPVKALAAGKVFKRPTGGFVGVSNVGLDDNWFGNHLSQANLYGFGRLAWNPDLTSNQIDDEWTRQTFGDDPDVLSSINRIQLTSWRTYENYTGPLGLQTLTDIVGNHFGVSVEASERNGWGQWHRADEKGVGMDRTVATGTGYIGQYRPPVARVYESIESCPDELLVFLHHVPYTHKLRSGKTVIQHIYDSHYEGAQAVDGYVEAWRKLAGKVDERRYKEVLEQLEYQSGQAQVWRDAVTNWFFRTSSIADDKGRVGRYPGRYEAEALKLEGYQSRDVTPWEGASAGKGAACTSAKCSAALRFDGQPGWHTIRVQYFDQNDGVSRYQLSVQGQIIDEWAAADRLPTRKMDSSSSKRRVCGTVALRPGDEIRIDAVPDGPEPAGLDYIELIPAGR